MSLVSFRLSEVFQQLLHEVTEFLLKVLENRRVVVLRDVLLDELTLSLFLVLTFLHLGQHFLVRVRTFLFFVIVHLLVRIPLASVENVLVFHVVEEPDDDSREEESPYVDLGDDPEQMLVCQQALLETFVEEFGVVHHDIVNRLHCPQLLLELVVIGL